MGPTATRSGRREAICEAVFELLGEVGYDRMSMDAVAARAHASKATIYRAWPNKPDLTVASIAHKLGPKMPAPPDTGSLRGDLLAHMRAACVMFASGDGAVMCGLLTAAASNPELSQVLHRFVFDTKRTMYDVMVTRAVERGELAASTDPGLLHELTHAVVTSRRMLDLGPLDDAFAERVVDRILLPVLKAA